LERYVQVQRKLAKSPFCEFDFLAARTRRKENAASVKSSALPRSGKTGHSCKTQQDQSGELTDCGQTGLMRMRLLLAQHFLAVAAHHIWQRSIFHQISRSN
jgi:hypothetical protein